MTDQEDCRYGRIKLWDSDEGYAIVSPNEGGPDTFVELGDIVPAQGEGPSVGNEVCYFRGLPLPNGPTTQKRDRIKVWTGGLGAAHHSSYAWAESFMEDRARFGSVSDDHIKGVYDGVPEHEAASSREGNNIKVLGAKLEVVEAQMKLHSLQLHALQNAIGEVLPDLQPVDPARGRHARRGAISDEPFNGARVQIADIADTAPSGPAASLSALAAIAQETPEGARAYAAQDMLMSFGSYIRQVRLSSDMTLEDLAEKAGTTIAQLSQIERANGKRGPSLDLMARILWALGKRITFETGASDADR